MSRVQISKRLVLINSASSAVVLVLNLTVLIWLQQYLLKRISPEEYALLPPVMAAMAFAPLITMVLTGGLGRYITVAYARGDDEEITRICSTMFPLLLIGGIVFLCAGWVAAWHVDRILVVSPAYLDEARLMLALLVFSTAVRLPAAVFGSGFVVRQKLMLQDFIDVGCQLVRIGLLFALLLGFGAQVLWVTVALVVSELLNLLISVPVSMRLVPAQRVRWGCFSWSLAKELTSYGGWGMLNQFGETLKQAAEPLILNRFSTAMDVSIYYVGGIAPRQLRLLMGPLSRPFIPVLAAAAAVGDMQRLRNIYLRVARYQAWVLMLFVIPAGIFGNDLMMLYIGPDYAGASIVMGVLLCVGVLGSFNALGVAVAAAIGDMKGISLRMTSVQILSVILGIFAVANLNTGASGLAIAALVSVTLFEASIVWPYCRKLVGADFRLWLIEVVKPAVMPAIIPLVFCIAVKGLVAIDNWWLLIAVSTASASLYGGAVLVFFLRPEDKRDLSGALGRLFRSPQ